MPARKTSLGVWDSDTDATKSRARHRRPIQKTAGEAPEMPPGMSPEAMWMWSFLRENRGEFLAKSDAAAMEAICEVYALMKAAFRSKKGVNEPVRLFIALARDFGLTPSSRANFVEMAKDMPEGKAKVAKFVG